MISINKINALWATGFLALAVILGAFGAHGLEASLPEKALKTYQTGVTYQFYHGIALFLIAILGPFTNHTRKASICFISGIFFFSFHCYLYALTQIKTFALIVPFGGLLFIAGWLFLFTHFYKAK